MKRFLALLPLPLSLLLRFFASLRPDLAELFSARVYPALAAPVSRLAALVPVPAVEPLVVILVIVVLYWFAAGRFFRAAAALCAVASVFFAGFGLNYFRQPLETTLGLTVAEAPVSELAALCESLATDANLYRAALAEAPEAGGTAEYDPLALVGDAMNRAADAWPIPKGAFGPPKRALVSPLLSRLLIEGISSPFTAEALVNGGIPAMSLPFVACHEAAHTRGFAREEDANLIAYLACMASEDPCFRYSGSVSALLYCLDALQSVDGDAYAACRASLSEAVRDDLSSHAAYWAQFRGTAAAKTSGRVNDAYLRVIGGEAWGARSYGRIVDLLLAQARAIDNESGKEKP